LLRAEFCDSDSFPANENESDAERLQTAEPHRPPGVTTQSIGGGQIMDFTRGALLWLLGVPLPIILLIALFWHH
jgi:hypothetical protein